MKISTWNIRHGGGSRLEAIKTVLNSMRNEDVLVITEFRSNKNGLAFKAHLNGLAFSHQFSTVKDERSNGVLIASKEPISCTTDEALGEHSHRVAIVECKGFKLFGCYFPQQKQKQKVFDYLIAQSKNLDNAIITGDINTGLHYADETGASFYCANALKELQDNGMPDAFRHLHGGSKEFTWYSHAGNGFRIDHFMVSTNLLSVLNSCHYNHDPRIEKASDHSTMSLELDL